MTPSYPLRFEKFKITRVSQFNFFNGNLVHVIGREAGVHYSSHFVFYLLHNMGLDLHKLDYCSKCATSTTTTS